jgi:hypothetical protein
MFKGKAIFSAPFEKILDELLIEHDDILVSRSRTDEILGNAPDSVRKAALRLQQYAEKHHADLYLIGSRARGKRGVRADWDFGIYFSAGKRPVDFSRTKQSVSDMAFPHRVDIVDLGSAPSWFLKSIVHDALHMTGQTSRDIIFQEGQEVA